MHTKSVSSALRLGTAVLSAAFVLALPAQAADTMPVDATGISEDAPVDDFADALYGFDSVTGQLALQSDVGYVYCPEAKVPVLAFQPDAVDQAKSDLSATVNADGTWTIPGLAEPVRPQTASSVYATEGAPVAGGTLPVVTQDRLVLVRAAWPNCRRLRWRHRCTGSYHCPRGCVSTNWPVGACAIGFQGTNTFRLCRYTGNWWDWCYEYTTWRCTASGYPCRDCTGVPLWTVGWAGWSCL